MMEIIEKIKKIVKIVPEGLTLELITPKLKIKVVKPLPRHKLKGVIITLTSPEVGYFYSLVWPGKKVKRGEKIGLIKLLGLKKQILAPSEGIVKNILVKKGKAVEYSQPLFEIFQTEARLK